MCMQIMIKSISYLLNIIIWNIITILIIIIFNSYNKYRINNNYLIL
jgi:hypothetical protein